MAEQPSIVTDPEVLARFKQSQAASPDIAPDVVERFKQSQTQAPQPMLAPDAIPVGDVPQTPVDPAHAVDADKSLWTGIGRGALELPGMFGDLGHLAMLGGGKLTGNEEMADFARKGLAGENTGFRVPSSGDIGKWLDAAGILPYKTQFDENKGAGKLGEIVGGIGAAATNPVTSLRRIMPEIVGDYASANVVPRIATDLGDSATQRALGPGLGQRYGAQGAMKDAAQQTQDELGAYAKQVLGGDNPKSLQAQGTVAQGHVDTAIAKLTQQTDDAYTELGKVMGSTKVDTTNTQMGLHGFLDQVENPELKAALSQDPTFQRFADVFAKNQQLPWGDMQAFMRYIGQSMRGATGSELGSLKTIYRGAAEDMRTAAKGVEGGEATYGEAINAAKTKSDALDDILGGLDSKNPETLPGFLMQQSKLGGTRLDSLQQNIPPEDWNELGSWLLRNKSVNASGDFDLPTMMKNLDQLSPEAKTALEGTGALGPDLARVQRLWDATKSSREMASLPLTGPSAFENHLMQGGTLGGIAGAATGHPLAAAGAGVAAAYPAIMRGAAAGATNPAAVRFLGRSRELAPDMATMGGEALAHMPTPDDAREWFSNPKTTDDQRRSYIAQKLPSVARQLDTGSDEGNRAALAAVMMNPTYRKLLYAPHRAGQD